MKKLFLIYPSYSHVQEFPTIIVATFGSVQNSLIGAPPNEYGPFTLNSYQDDCVDDSNFLHGSIGIVIAH